MAVRYKFKSEKNFSQILFDGLYISVADVKKEIYQQRRLGRSENVDLKVSGFSDLICFSQKILLKTFSLKFFF